MLYADYTGVTERGATIEPLDKLVLRVCLIAILSFIQFIVNNKPLMIESNEENTIALRYDTGMTTH